MKKLFLLTATLGLMVTFLVIDLNAQQVTQPRAASPAATVSQTIGLSSVTVNYSRPSVKGRDVWGKLVPYGWNKEAFGSGNESPWRSGANENTVIEFSHPGKVEGVDVPAGKYGLFFVINQDNSGEVILSKDYRSWGNFFYTKDQDQLRAKIQVRDVPHTETLTYGFINITANSTELVLNWEKKQFPVKIEFAVNDIVIANAGEELKGPIGFNWQGFQSAANYSLQNNVHLDKGLAWANTAVAQNRSFATLRVQSGILKATGKTEEAEKIMKDAMAIATEGELNIYGYQLLGNGDNEKAIEILKMNTERFPKSANTWDSLGEAYALKGDKPNAIKNFKKSLSMNPPANVKANSEKYLKQLGAL
jgi:hypothetical protein